MDSSVIRVQPLEWGLTRHLKGRCVQLRPRYGTGIAVNIPRVTLTTYSGNGISKISIQNQLDFECNMLNKYNIQINIILDTKYMYCIIDIKIKFMIK